MVRRIFVSILNADLGAIASEIEQAERGGVDGIHVDVMDGHFVPNLSLGPGVVESIRSRTTLPIDVHLMIERPEPFLDAFIRSGADRITIHQEATPHLNYALSLLRDKGIAAGLALNPGTPIGHATAVADLLDTLLVMTVNPGFGGQPIVPGIVRKVAQARAWLDENDLKAELQVDGGVKVENIAALANAGASLFVAGTSVFNDNARPAENLAALQARLREAEQSA